MIYLKPLTITQTKLYCYYEMEHKLLQKIKDKICPTAVKTMAIEFTYKSKTITRQDIVDISHLILQWMAFATFATVLMKQTLFNLLVSLILE